MPRPLLAGHVLCTPEIMPTQRRRGHATRLFIIHDGLSASHAGILPAGRAGVKTKMARVGESC
jgi:hypothetical protein